MPSNLLTRPKDWGCFESIGRLLGASGLSAIVFNHRFFGLERALDAMIDTRDLLDYVRENSEALGIDKNRLCLWSFSGGGVYLSPFLRETPDWLRAVVAYYSALHAPQPEFSAAMQISQNAGRIPALLTARAGLDMPALNEGIDLFIREALKKNASLDVYELLPPANMASSPATTIRGRGRFCGGRWSLFRWHSSEAGGASQDGGGGDRSISASEVTTSWKRKSAWRACRARWWR